MLDSMSRIQHPRWPAGPLACLAVSMATVTAQPSPAGLLMKVDQSALHVSRDGNHLLFVDWPTGELWLRNLVPNTDRQLTHKASGITGQYTDNALFSRDGRQIAFNWYRPDRLEVRIVATRGSPPHVLKTESGIRYRIQDWSLDGRELLVLRETGTDPRADLGFLSLETEKFRLIMPQRSLGHARLSPDGSRIAISSLSRRDPTQNDIEIIEAATGKSKLLLDGPEDDFSPEWSPDGAKIIFVSYRGNKPRLWALRWATPRVKPELLGNLPDGDNRTLGVTESGAVFTQAGDLGGTDSYVGLVDWNSGRVTGVRMIHNPPFWGSRRAVPSPDGHEVAFFRRRRGYVVRPGWQTPVVQSIDGLRDRAYPTALTLRDEPAWTPDSKSLLFPMPPEGSVGESAGRGWRFVDLNLTSGIFREIGRADSQGLVRMAGVTSRSVFYLISDYQGLDRVMALDRNSGSSRELFRMETTDSGLADAAVLGEAERLAPAIWRRGKPATISVVTPQRPDETAIGEVQTNSRPQLVWSPDGQAVLVSGSVHGQQGIWRVPVDKGSPQRLNIDEPDVTEVRLSGDGRRIAFTRRLPRPSEISTFSLSKPQRGQKEQ